MSLQSTVSSVLWGDDVVRVPTAVDPLIWICAITTPCFLTAAWSFESNTALEYCLVVSGAIPILTTQFTRVYLILRDPDHMQAVSLKMRPAADRGCCRC